MVFDLDQFDALLLKSIDDVFTEVVGEVNSKIIFDYLEKKSGPICEIYERLDTFSEEIRMLLGSGRGQMLGSARVLERTVLEVLGSRIGMAFDPERIDCSEYVRELKEAYKQKRQKSQFKIEMEVKNP